MSGTHDEAAAHSAAPIWNPSANSPSPPRFRPKLKSSLPRVLLQDNRSLSHGLERQLTGLLKARARALSYWESSKRKLVTAQSSRLDGRLRSSTQPATMQNGSRRGRRPPEGGPDALPRHGGCEKRPNFGARGPPMADGAQPPSPPNADASATGPSATLDLPSIHGATKAPRKTRVDSASPQPPPNPQQPQQGDELWRAEELPLPPHQQHRRVSLDGSNNRSPLDSSNNRTESSNNRPPLVFSRSVSLAPVAPGRLQYDIQHQIEEEDRFVAFLTFKSKPRVTHAGRLPLGV